MFIKKIRKVIFITLISILFLASCGAPKAPSFFDDSYLKIELKGSEYFLAYHEGWVYFQDNYYNDPLYRMRLDGTERQNIAFDGSFSGSVFFDGWIYYSSGYFDMSSSPTYKYILCRMRPDGSEQTVLENNVACFTLHDGWIYFCHMYGGTTLFRIRPDGTGKMQIAEGASQNTFLIADDYIFFQSGYTGSGQSVSEIYRCDTDGKNRLLIVSENSSGINLRFAGSSRLYYEKTDYSQTESFDLHRIDFSGENDRIIFSSPKTAVNQALSTIAPLYSPAAEGYFLNDVFLFNAHAGQGDSLYVSYSHYTKKSGTSFSFEKILIEENPISVQKVIEKPYGEVGSLLAIGDALFYRIADNSSVSLYSLSSNNEHSLIYRTGNVKVYSGYFIAESKLVVIARV